jgi:hypothetical protein
MGKRILILIICIMILPLHFIKGQNQQNLQLTRQDSLAILQKELSLLKAQNISLGTRLDSLISQLKQREGQAGTEDDIQKLLEEAARLSEREKETEESMNKKFQSGVRQQQGLNPNISLGGDFFTALSSSDNDFITEPGDVSYGNNGFYLREVELALESALDPFTRGKTFISITSEGISIEEAYMEWLNLPLNMNLKAGIFYSEFGPLNRYHDHALPQFDRPRALVNLFSNGGLGGAGLSTSFMLPELIFADATNLDLTIIKSPDTGDDFSFTDEGLLYIGQFKNFYDLTQNSYFEIRISGIAGRNPTGADRNSYVGSVGLSYKWVPMGREKYRTFDWKTEFLYSYREDVSGIVESKGFYSTIQNKLNARFWAGARIGYSELPYDNSQSEWDYSINLDFWQSEFVFTRLQYQYNHRSIDLMPMFPGGTLPSDHMILLQICWAMGPHKHEAY